MKIINYIAHSAGNNEAITPSAISHTLNALRYALRNNHITNGLT
jgi:3-dehydroquinate dehydratase